MAENSGSYERSFLTVRKARHILLVFLLVANLSGSATFACDEGSDSSTNFIAALEAEDYEKALTLAGALDGEITLPEKLDEPIFAAAKTYVGKMELESAVVLFRLLLDHFPDSQHAPDSRSELLGCYNFLRELDLCIAQAKINLELDPDSRWVEYWKFILAQSHFRLWEFETAEPLLNEFLDEYPAGEYAKHAKSCLEKINPDWDIGENGLVAYSGKFESDIRLQSAMDSLEADKEGGFKMLEKSLGIDLRPHTNAICLFEDSVPGIKTGVQASTYVVGIQNRPAIVMRFYSEFVVSRPRDYRLTLAHEIKHAGLKGIMGQGYENLPAWVKEGLAVWGTNNTDSRLQLVLSNKIAGGKDPMEVLDGIDDEDHNNADYMEDSLAFAWLESKKPGNVEAFCRELITGRPYREIWVELSGMSYENAIAEANDYCRARVIAALGDDYDEFVRMRKASETAVNGGEPAAQKWVSDGSQAEFEEWIEENPEHPATPMARFCIARVLARAGEGEDARKLLQSIIDNDSLRCTLTDDAQFWIGVSYNWEKDFDGAKKAFGILLRDYTSSHSARQVAGKFEPAGPVIE